MIREPRAYLALFIFFTLLTVGPPSQAQNANAVWVVPIEGQITPATTQFVASRIEEANDVLPLALVFLIDTPGRPCRRGARHLGQHPQRGAGADYCGGTRRL